MDITQIITLAVPIAIALGALALFFKKGGDKEASALDQNTIRAYRDSELVMQKTIDSLKAQLQTKDEVIERLVHDGKSRKNRS